MLTEALLNLKAALEDAKITNSNDLPTIGLTEEQLHKLMKGPLSGLVYKSGNLNVGLGFYWITIKENN